MEYIILGLLIIQDCTIYQLNSAFNSGLALIYSSSYGSIQSAIKKLLKAGQIGFTETVKNGRNKKIYQINQTGIDHFFQWMRDDIPLNKLEIVALSKVFFLGLVESDEEKKKILEGIIQAITQMESELEQLSDTLSQIQMDEESRKIFKYQFRTLDYGIVAHKSGKEWFQKLLDELKEN